MKMSWNVESAENLEQPTGRKWDQEEWYVAMAMPRTYVVIHEISLESGIWLVLWMDRQARCIYRLEMPNIFEIGSDQTLLRFIEFVCEERLGGDFRTPRRIVILSHLGARRIVCSAWEEYVLCSLWQCKPEPIRGGILPLGATQVRYTCLPDRWRSLVEGFYLYGQDGCRVRTRGSDGIGDQVQRLRVLAWDSIWKNARVWHDVSKKGKRRYFVENWNREIVGRSEMFKEVARAPGAAKLAVQPNWFWNKETCFWYHPSDAVLMKRIEFARGERNNSLSRFEEDKYERVSKGNGVGWYDTVFSLFRNSQVCDKCQDRMQSNPDWVLQLSTMEAGKSLGLIRRGQPEPKSIPKVCVGPWKQEKVGWRRLRESYVSPKLEGYKKSLCRVCASPTGSRL